MPDLPDLPDSARAMVLTGVRQLELQTFPLPQIGPDDGLLRMEVCGICGSDYEQYNGEFSPRFPTIPGHEPVGRIAALGDRARERWGVEVGDLVAVEPGVRCGVCAACRDGRGERCPDGAGYGYTLTDRAPSLWGGYAEYMYLHPATSMHLMPPDLPPRMAALYNPLGAGFAWAVRTPDLQVGQSVVIQGAGQRGLCSVVAARAAGAGQIIVTGLPRDEHKLALARDLGADLAIEVDSERPEQLLEAVLNATNGRGADVVLDVTPYASQPVVDAMRMARRGGTVVLAGLKGSHRVPEFDSDQIVTRALTVKGVFGVDRASFLQAIDTVLSGRFPLDRLHSHAFALEDAALAIDTLAGTAAADGDGRPPVNISIEPWLGQSGP